MRNLPTLFFLTAAIFALLGMIWGIQMSATHDHTLSPAHGHLNLIGFVAMSIFGTYYALTPNAASSRLAVVHFAVTTTTVLTLTPGIVLAITEQSESLAQIGSVLAVATMVLFGYIVFRHGVGSANTTKYPDQNIQSHPAQ
ncbi:MAG: hypothetical protein ACU0A6_15885 [Shimia sp.]|uniref:hypothetical protein n=1 Tax=Shimia sp. TaxID=1954381 RepID=UPI0040592920